MKKRFRLTLLLGAQLLFWVPVNYAVTIIGSDLLGPAIQSELAAFAQSEGISVRFQFEGTYQAVEKIESSEAQLALIAVVDESELDRPDLSYYPLAFQAMTLLVQENNPLRQLSYTDIAAIFRMGGQFNNWSALIDDPTWRSRKIGLAALRYENSLAVEIFKSVVMPGAQLKTGIRYFKNINDMRRALTDDNTLIALYPSIVNDPLLRMISVSSSKDSQAYSPTVDNIYFGDYPFRLPYYMVMKSDDNSEALSKIAEFLYSKQMAMHLTDKNWIPLPESERLRFMDIVD